MKIDQQLNLVQTLSREGEPDIHIHSMPLARPVFESNYRIIARAHAELFGHGPAYAISSGPRIASLALKDAGRQIAAERGIEGDGGAVALLAEIRRLSNVLAPGQAGWDMLPVDAALQKGVLSAEEWTDAESVIVFFILLSAMTRRALLQNLLASMASVVGAQIASQNVTEFAASLPILTPNEPIQKAVVSSVPY
jgi:hypothetical protein